MKTVYKCVMLVRGALSLALLFWFSYSVYWLMLTIAAEAEAEWRLHLLLKSLGAVIIVSWVMGYFVKKAKRERKRIKKTYRVGEYVTVTKFALFPGRVGEKWVWFRNYTVECVVSNDYQLIPVNHEETTSKD